MEKTRLWNQTEEAFRGLHWLNTGTPAEKELAAMALKSLMDQVVSPTLRKRIEETVRKFTNARLISEMRVS